MRISQVSLRGGATGKARSRQDTQRRRMRLSLSARSGLIVLIFHFWRRSSLSPCKSCYRKTYAQILRWDLRHSLGLGKSDRAKQRSHIDLIDDEQLRGGFDASDKIGNLLNLPANFQLNADFGKRTRRFRIEHPRRDNLRPFPGSHCLHCLLEIRRAHRRRISRQQFWLLHFDLCARRFQGTGQCVLLGEITQVLLQQLWLTFELILNPLATFEEWRYDRVLRDEYE